jgi:DNA-binding PadR family transcriptional regulator
MSPVFSHGHLRLYLLDLIATAPRHGYELIVELGKSFGGTYVPSAGTIYPRLAKLEDEGLVTKTADGRKTIYSITDAGRAELDARRSELDGIEEELTDSVRRLADEVRSSVNSAMKSLRADLASATRDAREESKRGGTSVRADPHVTRVASREELQSAEVVLAEFRHQVRLDLRSRVASGELGPETVAVLRTGLEEVRRAVQASMQGPGRAAGA